MALVALIAGVVVVANTPRPQTTPGGADLSAYRDQELHARPDPAEIDLVDHPLYDVAMPPAVECDLPGLDVDSDTSWQTFAQEAGLCLDDLWAPVMEELRLVPESPEITVSDEGLDSDTEDSFTLAYYESDRRTITVVLPNVREVSSFIPAQEREVVWLALMGHEYAHHVQDATGILRVSHDLRRTAGSEDDEMDTLRRTELQAECMAGVGLRGLTTSGGEVLDVVNRHFNDGGDLDTHGSAASRTHWLQEGWDRETVAGCNTYGAAPHQVG
ncbi:neutral zinc metallopeptidase [Nocardiopsis sp. MG754419]|uniref:neutral zinc metallopeptidase n=1 Tax=Nocardiopsis sp. MG754419 TaxID=2259865 RepID=UPI001BAD1740|nr:neutral zinc metallopeptidase [Nocardiopsis sp. MG754419]MBR8744657.1 neutral zinc metallopeptidase [Nocardiopsis sp. MG754419]